MPADNIPAASNPITRNRQIMIALPAFLLGESYRSDATDGNRQGQMIAIRRWPAAEKTERIQALLCAIPANPWSAGKMPGSGVTSCSGMGDNLLGNCGAE